MNVFTSLDVERELYKVKPNIFLLEMDGEKVRFQPNKIVIKDETEASDDLYWLIFTHTRDDSPVTCDLTLFSDPIHYCKNMFTSSDARNKPYFLCILKKAKETKNLRNEILVMIKGKKGQ
jgi:hypothetical protein